MRYKNCCCNHVGEKFFLVCKMGNEVEKKVNLKKIKKGERGGVDDE